MLLAHCTDVNSIGDLGSTPLHFAALAGRATMVAALLAAGADWTIRKEFGQTALRIAERQQYVEVIALLRRLDE